MPASRHCTATDSPLFDRSNPAVGLGADPGLFFKPFQFHVELAYLGVQAFWVTLRVGCLGTTFYVKQLTGIFQ